MLLLVDVDRQRRLGAFTVKWWHALTPLAVVVYVISVNGRPMAELRPFLPVPTPGRFKDAISFDDDAFAPMPDDEADQWGV